MPKKQTGMGKNFPLGTGTVQPVPSGIFHCVLFPADILELDEGKTNHYDKMVK